MSWQQVRSDDFQCFAECFAMPKRAKIALQDFKNFFANKIHIGKFTPVKGSGVDNGREVHITWIRDSVPFGPVILASWQK